jgi:hypothetical protein
VQGRALLCGAAVAVSGVLLTLYAGAMVRTLSREEPERLGRFAASVLALNARYGVLTADRPLLRQLLEDTIASSGQDVVGVVIRNPKQEVLAQVWSTGESPPALPSATDAPREQRVFTGRGEGLVFFSAPVMVVGGRQQGQVDLAMRTTQARRSETGVVARMLAATAFLTVVVTLLSGRVLAGREE